MATKRRFDIWFDVDQSLWFCRYVKYGRYRASAKTPPAALAGLIYELDKARKEGKDITL